MPNNTLYQQLTAFADQIAVIDTHEHLPSEEKRLASTVDFATLFSHYCLGDMVSAGLRPSEETALYAPQTALEEKWRIFQPYYDLIKNGSYSRAARIGMERFYGLSDLTSLNDAITVTERMRQANTPGLYQRVLRDACSIETSFLFNNDVFETDFFHFVDCLDHLLHLNSIHRLRAAVSEMGGASYSLSHYVEALSNYIKSKAARGVKGIKFTSAYYRDLNFQPVSFADADRIFSELSSSDHLLNFPADHGIDIRQTLILQDYLTMRVLDECDQLGLPVVFHTGLQAGNRNNPWNTRPEPLWNLFYTYPNLTFLLLHGGLPWMNETAMLAKSFPNVYIDMAWMHIISPELSVSSLKTWIDMLPKNKVTGFGGDYMVVEKVYGHLTMAKQNICRALSEKVAERALTENEAYSWIEHLLRKNAADIYHLNESSAP